jgi:hypothetical protein
VFSLQLREAQMKAKIEKQGPNAEQDQELEDEIKKKFEQEKHRWNGVFKIRLDKELSAVEKEFK